MIYYQECYVKRIIVFVFSLYTLSFYIFTLLRSVMWMLCSTKMHFQKRYLRKSKKLVKRPKVLTWTVPEEVDTRVGAKVMFLDNSVIELGISNGSTGIVVGVTINGQPKVAFPTINGIEVCDQISLIVSNRVIYFRKR